MSGMRVPLVVALLVVAALSVVNVNALQSGSIHSAASISVVSSDSTSAFLQIQPGTGNAVNQTTMTGNGILQVDFRRGYGGTIFALNGPRTALTSLAGDDLRFKQVFTITNNSDYCIDLGVSVPSAGPSHLLNIFGTRNGTEVALATSSGAASSTINLGTTSPNNLVSVDFRWSAASGVSSAGNFQVRISSQRSATCP